MDYRTFFLIDSDPKEVWRQRLQAGERIRTIFEFKADAGHIFVYIVGELIALVISAATALHIAVSVAFLAVLLVSLIALKLSVSGYIEFTPGYLELRDWRGKVTRIEYGDIISASSWFDSSHHRWAMRRQRLWEICACHSTWTTHRGARWKHLFTGPQQLIEAIGEELSSRAGLSDTATGESGELTWQTWQKRGRENDVPQLTLWI